MIIEVKVQPKSKKQKIESLGPGYKIWVRSAPEGGKANREVIQVLSKFLDIPPSRMKIIRGLSSRTKWVELEAGERAPE